MINIKNEKNMVSESVMNYRIPLIFIEELLKTEKFYNDILDLYENKNFQQISRDLCQSINFTQRMSAVARPVKNVIVVGEERISPRKNLVIEFNNLIYDLTNRQYNLKRAHINEVDQRNYDNFDKSENDEDVKLESLSNKYYEINKIFDKMYKEYLKR